MNAIEQAALTAERSPLASLLEQERLWIALGGVVGFAFFLYNVSLPGLLRGAGCCDASAYLWFTSRIHSWSQLFTDYLSFSNGGVDGLHRVKGYPFFLFFHRWLFGLFNLTAGWDWLRASLFTSFALHFAASICLYRSAVRAGARVHPIALGLVLASPGLTSIAALTLTDSVATSCMMLAFAGVLRRRPLLAGTAFGAAVLFRPSLQISSLLLILAWGACEIVFRERASRPRWKPWLVAPWALLGYGVAVSPQYVSCTRTYGQFCYLMPGYIKVQEYLTIATGWGNAMFYTLTGSRANPGTMAVAIPDRILALVVKGCSLHKETALHDELRCLAMHWYWAPFFFLKRVIGLFDHYHLNIYATWVTSLRVRAWTRIFGSLGFLGFLCVAALFFRGIRSRKRDPWLPLGFFSLLYIGQSTLCHVEPRYSLPIAAISTFAFVQVVQELLEARGPRRTWAVGALLIAAIVFNLQAVFWDRADPGVYEDIRLYLQN